jgi:DMSO/TMAO reductase YedYZ molybdopterin-dependent catalytic subunit
MDHQSARQRWNGLVSRLTVPVAGGVAATLSTCAIMVLARLTLQVRTVPERVLEAMLLVIPPGLFELALQRFGFDAKRYALLATILGMLALLAVVGAGALARRWSVRAVVATSLGLWLFVMLVVMPATDAGPFAINLINGTKAAVGAHLTMALAYAAALVSFGAWSRAREAYGREGTVQARVEEAPTNPRRLLVAVGVEAREPSRRSALVLGAGALSALLGTYAAVWWGPKMNVARVIVLDPDPPEGAGAGSGSTSTQPMATPTPRATSDLAALPATPSAQATITAPTTLATPVATPVTPAQPTVAPTVAAAMGFEPPPPRDLARDKDGVVLASGRRPGQLADMITENDHFYVVSKNAAGDPSLRLADWRLRVDGEVQRPIEVDYRSLRNLPPVEVTKTLECISNFVTKCELAPFGCDLISTARWKGARLGDILALAGGLKPGVSALAAVAADDFTTAIPIEVALDPETLLVYEMNGRTLPREHGYPARVLVPGRYGMKNAKWVIALRPLSREFDDWYGQRNWSKHAVVKTMTRIDTPERHAELPPGTHRIAGIAYAGDRGIQKVEYSADGGEAWQVAELIDRPPGRDVWIRWEGSFTLAPNASVTLMARATDGAGERQIEQFSLPQPDGSTGWHSLEVRAQSA